MKYLISILLISMVLFISCNRNEYSQYAYSLIEKQCSFGARVPGTLAHEKCIDFLFNELNQYVDSTKKQEFYTNVSYSQDSVKFTNIIGYINNNYDSTIMLCSHYDSRPFSNKEGLPTMGANDGASSTALLIAISKYLYEHKINKNIIIVLFDGEDAGRLGHEDEWFIGSKYFAQEYKDRIPDCTILLDMIGDSDLDIYKEGFSELYNYTLNNKIFDIAKKLKKKSFHNYVKYRIEDDHIPLNEKGFNAIDIIDMDYKYWHTPEDTPDKCSVESLDEVFQVIRYFLYE